MLTRSRSFTRTGRTLAAVVLGALAVPALAEEPASPDGGLQRSQALLMLDYQQVKVPGDAPIDFAGFHLFNRVTDTVWLGAGVMAPLAKGEYGGFMAFDIGAHLRMPLRGPWFATAGLSAGGGGGGRSKSQSTELSGTGGFAKAYLGLGYDFGPFTVGAQVSRLKFRHATIDGTQANVFVEIPYTYLSGPFSRDGERLSADEDAQARREVGENLLMVSLDNVRQRDPQGSFQGTLRTVDLQFSHFFAPDTYWFGSLGVGYRGLPIYNQVLGGVGQRWRIGPGWTLYGQLGLGSGGYAPEEFDTGPGLLVYPKLGVEYALTRNLGLSLTAGVMNAPKASSRNTTYGLALTHHLRPAGLAGQSGDEGPARWQGFRVNVFHQTDFGLRYRELDRPALQMVGVQVDTALSPNWYIPLQAAVAYNAYLGYPGYGELLTGLGWQTAAQRNDKWQWYSQAMLGANVHGTAVKGVGGLRYLLNERIGLHLNLGHLEARSASGQRFSTHSVAFGLDYRFAMPTR